MVHSIGGPIIQRHSIHLLLCITLYRKRLYTGAEPLNTQSFDMSHIVQAPRPGLITVQYTLAQSVQGMLRGGHMPHHAGTLGVLKQKKTVAITSVLYLYNLLGIDVFFIVLFHNYYCVSLKCILLFYIIIGSILPRTQGNTIFLKKV